MIETGNVIGLNPSPKKLTKEVVIKGEKVDPLSGRFLRRESSFIIRPSEDAGITFRIGDIAIPCDRDYLRAVDTSLGRMLCLRHPEKSIQIMLVEHLLSAIYLLGLSDIEIVLDKSSYGPLTSTKVPLFGLGRPTYWVPVVGPGVSGLIEQISPYCSPTGHIPEIIRVTREATYSITDLKYKIKRRLTIKPANRLIFQILSHVQPDIANDPKAEPITLTEDDDLTPFLNARPIMRIQNNFQKTAVFLLNAAGSSMLTNEMYVKSRPQFTREQVVARMHPQFQKGRNEHLHHAGIADRRGELGVCTEGKHIHGEFIMENANHVFHLEALRRLLTPEILGE